MELTHRSIQWWDWAHKWSSLISTAFLLMLCITGLPLIFHHEIEHLLMPHHEPGKLPEGAPPPTLESMLAKAKADKPGDVVPFMFFDDEEPLAKIVTAKSFMSLPGDYYYHTFDLRDGSKLDAPQPNRGFMSVMFRLHFDMYAGLWGTLFLGLMALLMVVAIVTGVVIYAPFMRRLDFGTVRTDRSRRALWLDLHNVLGIVTVAWTLVIAVTGAINTLGQPIERMWQFGQLKEMTAALKDAPVPTKFAPVDEVVANARKAAPGMFVRVVAFPGSPFASPHHFGIFLIGDTDITSRLLKPAVVNAATAEVTNMRDMPIYAKTLFISQPLHFGDYGGIPLKIIWALFDIITIVVLITGLYLWLKKRSLALAGRKQAKTAAESTAAVSAPMGGS